MCFLVVAPQVPTSTEPPPTYNEDLLEEQEYADFVGQLAFSLAFARLRRCLWLVAGWPCRMTRVLGDSVQLANRTVEEFGRDADIYRALKAMDGRVSLEERIIGRHLLDLTANRQLQVGLAQNDNVITSDFKDLIRQRSSGMIITQAVEDSFGEAKNARQIRGSKRFRKPARAMSIVLAKCVLNKRHRWRSVQQARLSLGLVEKLPKDVYSQARLDRSLKFESVVSTKRSPEHFSPSANNDCVPCADLSMLRGAHRRGNLKLVRRAWIGALAHIKHRLILCFHDAAEPSLYLAGYHFSESAVLCWPLKRVLVPGGYNAYYFELLACSEPVLRPIFEHYHGKALREVEGYTYKWCSWAWQYYEYPLARDRWEPCTRMFLEEGPLPLLTIAARKAFWSMPKVSLVPYCQDLGVALGSGASLFACVYELVKHIIGGTEGEILDIVHQRLVRYDAEGAYSDALLQCDAAIQMLDIHDHQTLYDEQKTARSLQTDREIYAEDYRKQRMTLHPPKGKAKAKAKGRGKGKPLSIAMPPPSTIPHADAKKYIPPTSSIWRGVVRGQWCGHCPPYARISEPWRRASEANALLVVVRKLWRQYLEINALGIESCWVENLFAAPEADDAADEDEVAE